jgi:7-cyano-7-deazaguanine synthase in queuosine biosynthesis
MMDDATLKTVTARILFESMTPEDREKLLTTAISTMLNEPDGNNYHDRRTRLQRAFDNALALQATDLVRDYLKTPEVHARLRDVIAQATNKVFESPTFVEGLAAKISASLWSDR